MYKWRAMTEEDKEIEENCSWPSSYCYFGSWRDYGGNSQWRQKRYAPLEISPDGRDGFIAKLIEINPDIIKFNEI